MEGDVKFLDISCENVTGVTRERIPLNDGFYKKNSLCFFFQCCARTVRTVRATRTVRAARTMRTVRAARVARVARTAHVQPNDLQEIAISASRKKHTKRYRCKWTFDGTMRNCSEKRAGHKL